MGFELADLFLQEAKLVLVATTEPQNRKSEATVQLNLRPEKLGTNLGLLVLLAAAAMSDLAVARLGYSKIRSLFPVRYPVLAERVGYWVDKKRAFETREMG